MSGFEFIGGLSGLLQIIGFSIQSVEVAHKIYSFAHAVKDAPSDIEYMLSEMRFLEGLLQEIERNEERLGTNEAVKKALEQCLEPLRSLQTLTKTLEEGLKSKNKIKQIGPAMDTVLWKNGRISKLKEKLKEAKQNILIALSLSLSREVTTLSHQSSTIITSNIDTQNLMVQLSSEVKRLGAGWNMDMVKSQLTALEKAMQEFKADALQQKENGVSLTLMKETVSTKSDTIQIKPGRYKVASWTLSLSAMPLGYLQYTTAQYHRVSLDASQAGEYAIQELQAENESRVEFRPSWLMAKLAWPFPLKFNVFRRRSQGLQMNLRSFNIVPSDSLIFVFCQQGNVDGVRTLLSRGDASINDVTEDGITPLHAAAGKCRADVCALLLTHGADRAAQTIWSETPFEYACRTLDLGVDGGQKSTVVSCDQIMSTVREFLKADEDIAEAIESQGALVTALLTAETKSPQNSSSMIEWKSPTIWLLNDILPAQNPSLLDRQFWQRCIMSAIRLPVHKSVLLKILEYCDEEMIRRAILSWIYCLNDDGLPLDDATLERFRLLVTKPQDLCFTVVDDDDESTIVTPIHRSIVSFHSFSKFREALERMQIDIEEVVRGQIAIYSDNWTEERLLALCRDPYRPPEDTEFRCKSCNYYTSNDASYLPWQRRVRRHEEGLAMDAPLDEEEEISQKEYEEELVDYRKGLCAHCRLLQTERASWTSWIGR